MLQRIPALVDGAPVELGAERGDAVGARVQVVVDRQQSAFLGGQDEDSDLLK